MSEKPKGFVPVMLTPFKENGAVDYDGLTKLTELYLNAGAAGLFANCQSSEMFDLTADERLAVTKHVVKIANGAVPVVAAATFGGKIAQQADFVKRMHDTGIEAAIIVTNMLAGELETDAVFEERVHSLFDQTPDIPFGFYECPEPFKRVLTAEQLKRSVETGRVVYHKDTCLDLELVKAKLAVTNGVASFGLYDAYMVHAVESLKAGSAGLSCIQGNYYPELVVWLCENYNNPSAYEQVAMVQQFFADHMQVMHHVYPMVAKYFLQKRALEISTFTRRFVGVFDEGIKRDISELYNKYAQLCQEVTLRVTIKT